ncbi:hypothetical protein F4813DRAFT_348273 [Daldinia decipiens]|uniref:uncharacterized protein n=1 Tax=Daldinia decipiens TaxID=326647 RepID=UPI0020C3D65C|nr:uncharacterized protein F4813DRAFT_348273 [Daldinia decipiens]KAI1660768.1 hypothetical protein F4813DRAFT_348273 [Daldinia decipiens]
MWQYTSTLLYWLVRPLYCSPVPVDGDITLDDAAAGRYAMCDGAVASGAEGRPDYGTARRRQRWLWTRLRCRVVRVV